MKKVPKLRFSGFAGEWEEWKLGELSSSFEYGLNAAATEYDGINKYIRITDIDDDSREFKQNELTSPDADLSKAGNYKLSKGDILFARTGASVGKSYVYRESDGLVYYAGFLIRARIKGEYNPEFVYQNTLTQTYERFIKVTSMRSGQPGVNAQEYSQFKIMLPSKTEQDIIADFFRNLDTLITLQQRKCDTLKKAKKFYLQNMFPRKGEKVPRLRLDGFTGDWEQRKFSDFAVRRSDSKVSSADCPCVEYEEVVAEQGILNKDINLKEVSKSGIAFDKGDVLYGKLRPYLHNWLKPDFKGVAVGDWWVLTPREMNRNFLYRLIQTVQYDAAANQSSGTKMPRADWKLISGTEFFVPSSMQEQKKVAETLDNLDTLITLQQRKCDTLKTAKKFMLQNMFI